MSTADDALRDYINHAEHPRTGEVTHAFMAGYRRALEDAADAANLHRQVPKDRDDLAEFCQDDECLWWDMTYALRDELRDRAAGVGTKDGNDDE